jgi:hypothetical protein
MWSLLNRRKSFLTLSIAISMRSIIICTHPQITLGKSSQGAWAGQGTWHAWESREKCTRFRWERPKERDHSEDQGVDGRMGSKWILRKLSGGVDWISLVQDRDWWRAVVSALMNGVSLSIAVYFVCGWKLVLLRKRKTQVECGLWSA